MYGFIYLTCPDCGQSSTTTDHRAYVGIYEQRPLTLWFTTSWLQRYTKLYLFWISLMTQLIWAHSHWNRTNLKIDPCAKGQWPFVILTFISRTKRCISFINFLFLMTQGRIWHALQPNRSMLTILVPCSFTPSCDPPAPDWFMCPP